jgi:hypothetical protein
MFSKKEGRNWISGLGGAWEGAARQSMMGFSKDIEVAAVEAAAPKTTERRRIDYGRQGKAEGEMPH